jgi:thiol-disulfide isomerase/thioredoxin
MATESRGPARTPADDDGPSGLATAALLGAIVLGFALMPRLFGHAEGPLAGKDAPDLSLKLVANAPGAAGAGGGDFSLASQHGHPVLLDFWATWCGPCRAEAPIVDQISQRYKDQGLAVVGVNTSDQSGNAGPWAREHGITYPIAYDAGDRAAAAYGVENLPTLVLISKTGKVVAMRTGTTTATELDAMIRREL